MRVRDLAPEDAPALTALYGEYEWWADREESRVRRALAGSDVAVGVETAGGDLVAAARVLTDRTFYAAVYDVIVATDRRREGVGRALMEGVRDHPVLDSVDGISLLCREGLVPFYESVGFTEFERPVAVPEGGTEQLVRMTYRE
jgi:GNAT superfamily N-acetyltransferase